jgi:quercetin dioxygenase-like cupin family protein
MRFLEWAKDGGPDSHVTGFFLVEIKSLFSIVLLNFGKGSREAFHSHAFNALTLWLTGTAKEHLLRGKARIWDAGQVKYTPRGCFHKVEGIRSAWALSFRGPWSNTWKEFLPKEQQHITLTHGRKVVAQRS